MFNEEEVSKTVHERGSSTGSGHVKRDGLVSKMLQDRNVLRFISAPAGFGKTALANEYAERLFSEENVRWIDASDPGFLLALDEEGGGFSGIDDEGLKLVVLDALPWLHEQRAIALSNFIDKMLYSGIEVIATTVPSCDNLGILQSDRLLINAVELLASESECVPKRTGSCDMDKRAFGKKKFNEASQVLFGRAPAVIWGRDADAQLDCLRGLFSESLPVQLLKKMFAMLLLTEGNVRELDPMGLALDGDDVELLSCDYPIFGIDRISGSFNVAGFELDSLKTAIVDSKLGSMLLEGKKTVVESAVAVLFKRGDHRRGARVIDTFCDDEKSSEWLVECGWDLMDAGEVDLVNALLERCPDHVYARSDIIQSMHAWASGLSGDRREACHISHRIVSKADELDKPDIACVASLLCLMRFDENAITTSTKPRLSPDRSVTDPVDFLAAAMDLCTNVELARALSVDAEYDDIRFEKSRRAPGKARARQFSLLFTDHGDSVSETRAFKIALHLLAHVDSPDLRRLVQELGCEAVLSMRRNGSLTFTDSLLVKDMWDTGYFGLVGPVMDRRDAKLLDGASRMLKLLADHCGMEAPQIPWEVRGLSGSEKETKRAIVVNSGVEEMYVRLFGSFEVSIGDRYITEGKWRKKSKALFALLVLGQGRDVPRDDLLNQLWPGLSRAHALDNFYTNWGNCTKTIGESPYIERSGEFCRIDPRFVRSDVSEFDQLARHLLASDHDVRYLLDTYAKIEMLYRGPLMPSEQSLKSVQMQRDRYRTLYVDAMVAATDCALQAKDVRIALWFARKAMDEDQTREDVYSALMKAQIAAGQRCSAMKTFFIYKEYMQNTLGLDPSFEMQDLYDSIITIDPELLRLETIRDALI